MSILTKAKSLAGKKGRGWLPSDPKVTDREYVPRQRAARTGDGVVHLEQCVPTIYSQGATGSCVAQAIAGAIGTRERWLGLPYTTETHGISRRDLYYRSRYAHGDHQDDSGTYIPVALHELRHHGVALERDFPWSETFINRGTPAVLVHKGFERSGLVYERIIAGGEAKLEALAAAFAEGLPVVFGAMLPSSFALHAGEQVYTPTRGEPTIGGHAMYCVAINPVTGDVLLVNSWGPRWGFGGRAWVSAQWVMDAWRDIHVMRGWRRVQNAERMEVSNA